MPHSDTRHPKVCPVVDEGRFHRLTAWDSAAAIHLTRNLAVELGPRHILCNSIAPGFFPSKMASGLMAMQGGEAKLAKLNPNGRLGKPEDVAAAVVYLSSRASSHVNSSNIVLDGGSLWARGRL